MSFITDRMLYGDIKVASQVIRESADLAASEAAKDHAHAMPWAAQIAVRTHTAIISSLQKTLHREQIGDPDMRLSHRAIIAAVCEAANAAGKAVTRSLPPHPALRVAAPQPPGPGCGRRPDDQPVGSDRPGHRPKAANRGQHRPQAAAPRPGPPAGRRNGPARRSRVPQPDRPRPGPLLPIGTLKRPTHPAPTINHPSNFAESRVSSTQGNGPRSLGRAWRGPYPGALRRKSLPQAITPAEFFAMAKKSG